MKLRKNVLGQVLNLDDGDHGIAYGYVKRKGYEQFSPALQSLMVKADHSKLSRSNLIDLDSKRLWPQSTKNSSSNVINRARGFN